MRIVAAGVPKGFDENANELGQQDLHQVTDEGNHADILLVLPILSERKPPITPPDERIHSTITVSVPKVMGSTPVSVSRKPPISFSRQTSSFVRSLLELGALFLIEDGAKVHDAIRIECFLEFLEHVVC